MLDETCSELDGTWCNPSTSVLALSDYSPDTLGIYPSSIACHSSAPSCSQIYTLWRYWGCPWIALSIEIVWHRGPPATTAATTATWSATARTSAPAVPTSIAVTTATETTRTLQHCSSKSVSSKIYNIKDHIGIINNNNTTATTGASMLLTDHSLSLSLRDSAFWTAIWMSHMRHAV